MWGRILLALAVSGVLLLPPTSAGAFRAMFPKPTPMLRNGVDPGKPLFLTPYIEKGDIKKALELSLVGPEASLMYKSYSGFLTVNPQYNSNMFFWFFPSQMDPMNAPVLLWLQGGPGGSSLFGLFVENGPLSVDKNANLYPKNITWNSRYSMLYIDNPVGTGFSFTDKDAGYASDEEDVANDLYSFLTQFFTLFKDYQKNPFYVTGESYAGKYVPAISYKIYQENPSAEVHINLQGMAIGDGLCDPITMLPKYSDFMFNVGLLDEMQADYFQIQAMRAVSFIRDKEWEEAFKVFDALLNGDLYPSQPYFKNATGTNNYYNFLLTQEPVSFNYYIPFLAKPEVRKAIHVGNLTYHDGAKVELFLRNDVLQSVKPWIATLMDSMKVMIYNGQLDIIIAVPLTETWVMSVDWSGHEEYTKVRRLIWKVDPSDTEVAGYVRVVKNFYQVIVRNAGHILPYDQPRVAFDMIQRFVENRGFKG